jgi:hypothetical protein
MKTLKMTFICFPALALLLTAVAVDEAQARIRVRGTLQTPHAVVHVDNGAYRHGRVYRQALPVRYYERVRVSQNDRKIARRLARYSGVPQRELIQLRKEGYSWREIGRWLGVPRKVVHAAKKQSSWKRFLNRHRYGLYSEIGRCYHDD